MEVLEPRLLLNADLLLDLSGQSAEQHDNSLLVRLWEDESAIEGQSGAAQVVQILDTDDDGRVLAQQRLDTIGAVEIRTGQGRDRVVLDIGSFSLDGGERSGAIPNIVIHAGTGEDTLSVINEHSTLWDMTVQNEFGVTFIRAALGAGDNPATVYTAVTGVENVEGGEGEDTLLAPLTDNLWELDGPGAGRLYSVPPPELAGGRFVPDSRSEPSLPPDSRRLAFSGMDNLVGSDRNDWFYLRPGGGVPGLIRGADPGSDTGIDALFVIKFPGDEVTVSGDPEDGGTVTANGHVVLSHEGIDQIETVLTIERDELQATGVAQEDDPRAAVATGKLGLSDPDAGQGGYKAQVDTEGTYGSFSLSADGRWIYRLDNAKPATDALEAGQTSTDSFRTISAEGTPTVVLITVVGADEVGSASTADATIHGKFTGSVTEDDANAGEAIGKLTVTDEDDGEASFAPLMEAAAVYGAARVGAATDSRTRRPIEGTYGTFALEEDGAWTYTLNNEDPDTNALRADQTAIERFYAFSADGTRAEVLITVTGAGDGAVIDGDDAGAVAVDDPVATGALSVSDPDAGDGGFQAQAHTQGTYGAFSLGARGKWVYTLDRGDGAAIDTLAAGDTETDRFELFSADGARFEVAITVTGADEAASPATANATVGGAMAGAVTEDDPAAARAEKTLAVDDLDAGEEEFQAQTNTVGTYGTFSLGSNGAWVYTLDNSDVDTDALRAGQTATDIFEVLTADGTRAEVIVTVTGANDRAAVGGIGYEDQVLVVTLVEDGDGTRRIRVLDRNDNDRVVADEAFGDISQLDIRTGPGADTIVVDGESFAELLESDDIVLLPSIAVDTGTGRDRLVVGTPETMFATWRLQGQGRGNVYGNPNDDAVAAIPALSFAGVEHIRGVGGSHTLVGPNHANWWRMTGERAGSVDGYSFENFDAIVGGGDRDLLTGTEVDTIWRISGIGAGEIVGLGISFAGMEAITGSGADDTLVGPAENTVWHLDGPDSGTVHGMDFSGMENLTGADDTLDQFYLGGRASLTGVIAGGEGGFDTLFFHEDRFSSTGVNPDPQETGAGNVELDGTVIRYTGMETPQITVEGTDEERELTATPNADELVLRWSEDGTKLVLDSKNGFMSDVEFDHPTGSLVILLGPGNDRITIEAFGDGRGASLYVRGETQAASSNTSDVIVVAENALISTRMLGDPYGDPMTAYSIGDSGHVDLDAERVHVRQGARILTHVVPGSRMQDGVTIPEAGDITLGDGTGGDAALIHKRTREVTIESRTVVGAFDPSNSVDHGADTIDFGSDHDLETGSAVRYFTGGGDAVPGLEDGTTYFAIVDTDRKIRLAESYAKAKAGLSIDIDDVGATGANHRITAGVLIDASGDPAGTAGAVTIQAVNRPAAVASPVVDFYVLESRIEITGATIRAGDVTINSEANARLPTVDGWAAGILFGLQSFASALPGMVLSMLTGMSVAVSVRHTSALVELHDTEVISSGAVTINSDAQSEALAYALTTSLFKTPNPVLIAASYGRGAATSKALITGATSISATGTVLVKANGHSQARSFARTSNQIEAIAQRKNPDKFDGSRWTITIAVVHTELTVRATVGPAAEIRSEAGNVKVIATGKQPAYVTGTTDLYVGGRGTLTMVATLGFADVKTTVDGRIYAAGAPDSSDDGVEEFDLTGVDFARDAIRVPGHGYATGDEIVYRAGGDRPSPIDGLVDGETYIVLVVDDETIQLARAAPVDLHPGNAKETSEHEFLSPARTGLLLNAVDEERDAIWLPGHSFVSGDTVTYTHDSQFGAIEGLEKGMRYLVDVDVDWISLRSMTAPPDAPVIELRQGRALGDHRFSAGGSKLHTLELGRIDAETDTVHREGHGLDNAIWGKGVYWRESADGLPDLESGSQFEIEVLDENSFRFRDEQTGETVDISDGRTPSEHQVAYAEADTRKAITPNADAIDAVRDTIRVEDHGWETGQTVIYGTDPNGITHRSVPVVDASAPALANALSIPEPDPEIGGLRHGAVYRVVVVDQHTVRLLEIATPLDAAQAIDLSNAGAPGGEHSLAPADQAERKGGITVSSKLSGSHVSTLWSASGQKGFSPTKNTALAGHYHDYTIAAPLLAIQWIAGMGGPLGSLSADLKNVANKTTKGNAGKTSIGANFTIRYIEQEAITEIGDAADLDSGADISVTANLSHHQNHYTRGRGSVTGGGANTAPSADRPDTSEDKGGGKAIALAGAFSLIRNTTEAIVHGGATLDAANAISVTAVAEQPSMFDPAKYLVHERLQTSGWIGTFWIWTGVLGLGRYTINNWTDTFVAIPKSTVEGKQPSVTAFAFDIHLQFFKTRAIVKSGVEINQDPIFAATDTQSVDVAAETSIVQVAVTGGSVWEKTFNATHVVSVMRTRAHGLTGNPQTRSSASSVGGLLGLQYLQTTTIALIEQGVAISIGPLGHLDVDAREDVLRINVAGRAAEVANEGRSSDSGFVFLGTALAVAHVSVTRAAIESTAGGVVDIDGGGNVSVNAESDVLNINLAGSFALGGDGASAVGISLVVAVVLRTTEAYVGHLSDEEDQDYAPYALNDRDSQNSSIGALAIAAVSRGGVYSFVLAGSVGAGTGKNAKTPQRRRATPEDHDRLFELNLPREEFIPAAHRDTANQNSGGFTLAGSMGVNYIEHSTVAALDGGGTFGVTTVDVGAEDTTDVVMTTGGAAVSYQRGDAGGGSNSSDSQSLSGAISANIVQTGARAFIRGAGLKSTAADEDGEDGDATDIRVRARRDGHVFSFAIALSADGSSNATAFAGSASFNLVEGVTHAFIDRAHITAPGDVDVYSKNKVNLWSIGGGVAGSRKTGVGASISYNHLSHDTRAWITGERRASDGPATTQLNLGGGLTVRAQNETTIVAVAVSLGLSVGSRAGDAANTDAGDADDLFDDADSIGDADDLFDDAESIGASATGSSGGSSTGSSGGSDAGSSGGSDAGSSGGSDAGSSGGSSTGSSGGSDAGSSGGSGTGSSGGSDAGSSGGSGTGSSGGSDTGSSGGSDAGSSGGSDPGSIAGSDPGSAAGSDAGSAAGSDAPAQGSQKKARGFAGAVTIAINIIAPEWSIFGRVRGEDVSKRGTAATIEHVDVVTGGDVQIVATDNPSIAALAGAVGIGLEARAFGAALGWNQVNGGARAAVTDTRISSSEAVSLKAEKGTTKHSGQATITALAIGGAGSKTGGAVGISAAVNGVIARVDAAVTDGSVIRADRGVSIEARDTSSINALTGAAGVSLRSYAGGVAASGNYIDSRVKAQIYASTVESRLGSVDIHAKQEANIRVATVGVAVAAKGVALAGSIGVQVVTVETVASIEGDSLVTAAHNVLVRAETDLTVGAGAGQISISGSGRFAGGAALNFTVISNRTEALIGETARIATTSAAGPTLRDVTGKSVAGVSVEASSEIFVLGIAVGGAVGAGVSASGSGTLNVISSTTRARVKATGNSQHKGVNSARDVNVVAESDLWVSGIAGALGAGKVGVGIGADVSVINHRTSAYIGYAATVEADGSVFVQALATESVVSVSAAVALAGSVAIGGSAGVGVLRSHTRAYIGDKATVWALGNVLVSADSDTKSWIASASLAASGTAAVGIGFQIGVLEKSTKAYIGDATVTALAHDGGVETNTGGFREALGFSGAEVDAPGDRITIRNHNLNDGDRVVYRGSTALTGLQDGTIYHVIRVDADTIRLAASSSNAKNRVAVNIGTTNGSAGAAHLLRRVVSDEGGDAHADFKTSAVDARSDAIFAEDHGFTDGQEVLYFTDARVLGGMDSEGRYWVIRVDDDRFKLAATREDAIEGRAIDLDTADMDMEQAHHVKALADESLPEVDNAEADPTILSARSGREPETTSRKGVIVVAVSTNDLGAIGAGMAFAKTGTGALTGSVTVHTIDTSAHIAEGARINFVNPGQRTAASDQDVHVNAARFYRAFNVGLSVAGAGVFAAAPAFAVPILKGSTVAYIQGKTTGGTYDTTVDARRDVTVTAQAESEIYAVTAGAALAVGGVALAGSVNVLVVDTETLASIAGRVRVTAGGNVLVSASDDTRTINVAGGIGLVGKGFAGAGAIPVTVITKRTTAQIGDHTIVDAAGRGENAIGLAGARGTEKALREATDRDGAQRLIDAIGDDQLSDDNHRKIDTTSEADAARDAGSPIRGVAVQARSSEDIYVLGASVSAGILGVAVGITVSVTVVDSDTVATVGTGAHINQNTVDPHEKQSVDIDARNVLEIRSVVGALGASLYAGVGAGVDIGIVRNDTQAFIGDGARIGAKADVKINAVSLWSIQSTAIAAAVAGGPGLAGAIIVYTIGGNFSDRHDHGGALTGSNGDAGTFGDSMVSSLMEEVQEEDDEAIRFEPGSAVDSGTDTIDIGSTHGLSTGDAVLYHSGEGEAIGGLEDGAVYFAIVDSNDPRKVRLAATHADALAGSFIDIDASDATGNSHRLSNDSAGLGNAVRAGNRDSLPDGRVGRSINNRTGATSGTVAGVGGGVEIRARNVAVTTLQILDVRAVAGAGAASVVAVAIGAGVVVLNVDADVVSYIRPGGRITGDGTGALGVTAHSSSEFDTRAYVGAVAASVVSVSDSSSVDALLGAGLRGRAINETTGPAGALVVRGFDAVSVVARGYFHHEMLAGVVAGAGIIAGAPGFTASRMEPEIRAAVGAYTELGPDDQGTEASRVGDVRVEAFADVNSIPADDKISVFALGLGGIAALGAGFARTNLSPVVGATIGTAALIDASGTVEVTAHADVNARINADGGAGSFVIGIGAMLGRIAIDSEVRARVGSQARVKGSSIRIRADNTVEGRTETTPSAGGILAGTGSDAETDIDAVTKVEIDERAVLQAVGLRDTETGEGGDIDIEAVSTTKAHATARGHAYGVIAAAGISRADAETRNQTSVNVRANAAIESLDGDVRLDAHAYDQLDVTSQIRGGAAIQVSEARADGQIGTGTQENPRGGAQIVVGQGARIAATRGDVDIGARLKARAEIDADGRNGGLGTGVDANADLEVLSWARTDIGRDVAIDALNIRIGASVYSLDLEVDANADSDALIGFVEATAYIDVASVASVTVGSGAAITGRESVVIEALHGSLDEEDNLDGLSAETDADADAAAIESANERAITVLNTETRVEVASGVEIAARSLLVEASADPHPEFSSNELTLDRSIDFNARVVLLPARSPLLVIDDQGRVVTNVGDTAVTLTADGGVEIGDIRLGDRTLGTVEFKIRASDHDTDNDGDTTTSRVLRGRPVIVGSNSFESVTIVNRSERYLRINDIAVQHRRAVESLAPAITGGISTSGFQATYRETTSPTKVVIEHTGAATAGVILAGVIDNAIGSTAITAMHGDISSTGTEISIHTGSLALSAAGDIAGGTSADPLLVATRILEADAATIRIEDRGTPGVDAVDIVRIAATAVHFKALKSIRGARGGSQAHIDADTIELVSVEGAVGEARRALRIDAGAAGDALSIAAAQGIHVSDVANGLSIGRVRSDSGDIVLTVENTAAATDHLTLDASARIQATSGSVILQAGDRIDLQQGSSIVAAGGGRADRRRDPEHRVRAQRHRRRRKQDLACRPFVCGRRHRHLRRSQPLRRDRGA